jgi:hypothetical protein
MARLYKIIQHHRTLEKLADDPEVEMDDLTAAMDGLSGDLEGVAKSIAGVIMNIEAEARAAAAAAREMAARARQVQERAVALRGYLLNRMIANGTLRISSAYFVIVVREDRASVNVTDAELIPEKFKKWPAPVPMVPTLDLLRIATALKDCEFVPGAAIQYAPRLEIIL